jgi:hypothetical protein
MTACTVVQGPEYLVQEFGGAGEVARELLMAPRRVDAEDELESAGCRFSVVKTSRSPLAHKGDKLLVTPVALGQELLNDF